MSVLRHFPAVPGQAPVRSLFPEKDGSEKLIERVKIVGI